MLTGETGVFDSGYIKEMGHGLGKWIVDKVVWCWALLGSGC